MTFLEYLILIFTVIAGGLIAFAVKKYDKKYLQIVLSFSGAYVLGITVLHLMPSIYLGDEVSATIGLWMLGGFFLQLLLEQFSSGVEHGHIHSQQHLRTGTIVSIMFGLCVHAFFEGIPLQDYDHFHEEIHEHSQSSGHFLYAIVLHKAPAAFALVLLLLLSNVSRIGVIICLLIFAGMTPLGALVASFFELSTMQLRILIAVVVGSFLHIATTILFEMDSTDHHQISFQKMLAIGIGLGIAVLTIH